MTGSTNAVGARWPVTIARCMECRQVVALAEASIDPRTGQLPTCSATQGPGSKRAQNWPCDGRFGHAPAEMQTAFAMGGGEAVIAMLDESPELGWYSLRPGGLRLLTLVA